MSKTGVAGYIASFPIPEVVMGINAFMLGAQSVNPDFKVKVVWANTWFDPGKEADAAKALIDQGVDIITQHTDSTAPMQVAEERGIKAFGQASDMIKFGPRRSSPRSSTTGRPTTSSASGGDRRHLEARRGLGRHGRRSTS
jgi:basic membrane protein A and related proteins